MFPESLWIGITLRHNGSDDKTLQVSREIADLLDLPRVACGEILMHDSRRRPLRDVLWSIRHGRPLCEMGYALPSNGARVLQPLCDIAEMYSPALLEETENIVSRCHFSLDELRYEYPDEGNGETPQDRLARLAAEGLNWRYPDGIPQKSQDLVDRELALIGKLGYAPYFLTVHDIVRFARSQGILCQGRGSAANSAVCYCLGITEVNPEKVDLIFSQSTCHQAA